MPPGSAKLNTTLIAPGISLGALGYLLGLSFTLWFPR
jgi:hypothetical protein